MHPVSAFGMEMSWLCTRLAVHKQWSECDYILCPSDVTPDDCHIGRVRNPSGTNERDGRAA
jgi:hypothetical protein